MANVSELITLGIGTPSSIAYIIRVGLGEPSAPKDENSVGGNPRLLRLRIRQINDTPRTFSRGNIRRLP